MRWWWRKKESGQQAPADPWLIGKEGFGAPLHNVFIERQLPTAGAMNFSKASMALPRYSPIGNGVTTQRGWMYDQPVLAARQGVTPYAIGSPGVPTGGFYAAPLVDNTDTGIAPETLAALHMPSAFLSIPRL